MRRATSTWHQSDSLVVLVLERGEHRILGDDLFSGDELVGDDAFGDFTQGNDGRLVVFPRYAWFLAAGRQLASALGREHDQLEAVIHVFQAVFNSYAGHGLPQ